MTAVVTVQTVEMTVTVERQKYSRGSSNSIDIVVRVRTVEMAVTSRDTEAVTVESAETVAKISSNSKEIVV